MPFRIFCNRPWPTEAGQVGYGAAQHLRTSLPDAELLAPPTRINSASVFDDYASISRDVDAIIPVQLRIDAEALDKIGDRLKVVATMSMGYDFVDVEECKTRGIRVAHSSGAKGACAETAVALLLMASRQFLRLSEEVKQGVWDSGEILPGLEGSTVGLIGLGSIGQAVVQRVRPFSPARVVYYTRNRRVDLEDRLQVQYCTSLDELLGVSDHVIIACALNQSTKRLINRDTLALMKPTAVLVNITRGAIVDQDALIDAVASGRLRAAGLDACTPEPLPLDHALLQTPNIVVTPHMASATWHGRNANHMQAVRNVIAGLRGTGMEDEL